MWMTNLGMYLLNREFKKIHALRAITGYPSRVWNRSFTIKNRLALRVFDGMTADEVMGYLCTRINTEEWDASLKEFMQSSAGKVTSITLDLKAVDRK